MQLFFRRHLPHQVHQDLPRFRRCVSGPHTYIIAAGENPGTGAKNPTPLRPGGHWNWSAFYAIAELFEFPDHPRRAGALGLGTYRRTPFLVAHPLVQNQPEQSAESMGDGPDGLLVSQTRQQPAERQLEYAPFGLDRRLSRLIQQ